MRAVPFRLEFQSIRFLSHIYRSRALSFFSLYTTDDLLPSLPLFFGGKLHAGHELPAELTQTLLRWTPTSDEELRLRLYTGEVTQLGPAEQFLRTIIDIPYIFQRLDALLFMVTLPEEAANAKQSFATLEVRNQLISSTDDRSICRSNP